MLVGAQRSEDFFGGVRIPKRERRSAIGPNDLGQGGEVVHFGLPEGVQVVADKRGAGQQQRHAAGEHDNQGQFAAD